MLNSVMIGSRSRVRVAVGVMSLLLAGCYLMSDDELLDSTGGIKRQKFVATTIYCHDCYAIFSGMMSIKDLSNRLGCSELELIETNRDFSKSTVIRNGEVVRLPKECRKKKFFGVVAYKVASSVYGGSFGPHSAPILSNNACILSVTSNLYSERLIPLFCPTTGKPVSFKKHEDGGALINTMSSDKVVAAAAGQVVMSSSMLKRYGSLIVIRHGYDYATMYGHLGGRMVKAGDSVQVGQPIAIPLCAEKGCSFSFKVSFKGRALPLRFVTKKPHRVLESKCKSFSEIVCNRDNRGVSNCCVHSYGKQHKTVQSKVARSRKSVSVL